MAFAAAVVWEVRTTGSDANGGGFDPTSGVPGTDYSQQAAAQVAYTDLVIDATTNTKCTSAGTPFTAAHVGNVINVTAGTGFTVQRVQILSVTAAVATCDKSLGTLSSTGGTGNLGGSVLTIGKALTVWVASNTIWVRGGTYAITTNLAVGFGAATPAAPKSRLLGYTTTRGDRGQPLISTTSAITMMTLDAGVVVQNFELDGTDLATNGVNGSTYMYRGTTVENLLVRRTKGVGIQAGAAHNCRVTALQATATAGFSTHGTDAICTFVNCVADANPCPGFGCTTTMGVNLIRCIAYGNTYGFSDAGSGNGLVDNSVFDGCVFYNNTTDGLRVQGSFDAVVAIRNCIFVNNGGFGVKTLGQLALDYLADYNAFYNNTSGARSGAVAGAHDVTLTGGPFVNAASGNFALNTTAGAGAACRAVGYPGVLPGGLTTGYLDIGAAQHADPAVAVNPASAVSFIGI